MNSSSLPHDSIAEENAALWAARLDGSELSSTDRAALEAWLAEKPSHRALLSEYCQFSADLEQVLPALAEAGSVQMPAEVRPSRSSWSLALAAGSALAAAAAIAVAVWLARPDTQFKTIATPIAQRQSITLADGTHVDLNARTSLQVEIGRSERHVRLSGGEAYFAVSKDKARPFIVETPAGSVRVTGTTFDGRTEVATALEVTVVEGSVQVRPTDPNGVTQVPELLGPGDRLSSGPAGVSKTKLTDAQLADAFAWRKGQVIFYGATLRDAVGRFARYTGRTITVAPDVANMSIGGVGSLDDLNEFLERLEQIYALRVTRDLDGTVHISPRAAP